MTELAAGVLKAPFTLSVDSPAAFLAGPITWTLLELLGYSSSLSLSFGTWGSTLQLGLLAERILMSLLRSTVQDPR